MADTSEPRPVRAGRPRRPTAAQAPRAPAGSAAPLPRDRPFDSTWAFLSEGYSYISNRCRALGSDAFRARLMLTPVVCMQGGEAARFFYGGGRFTRQGALPQITLRLLQDKGSVDWLDGAAHAHRKSMFLAMLTGNAPEAIAGAFEAEWRKALPLWAAQDRVVLDDAAAEVLCRAVCAWAGVPLADAEAPRRAAQLWEMFDKAGSPGPKGVRALLLRQRTERWARGLIRRVRNGEIGSEGSALWTIAHHRDEAGKLLSRRVAGVELINLLRPTVAVARFITFAAHALHRFDDWPSRIREGGDSTADMFVQEVRRLYPFFPVIAGRARQTLEWKGHRFRKGDWVMLDLYGTNHDERLWVEAESFRPERFLLWRTTGFDLVPQGAGSPARDHRCPGEAATVAIMKRAVTLLTAMRYDVPAQDLSIPLNRFPSKPASGFVMTKVGPAQTNSVVSR